MLTYDLDALCDLNSRVIFFPVRHHSPTAARLVRDLIASLRPDAVLIEGPSDFNDRIGELFLPHRPPLAVYSYVRLPNGLRRGAYYPLCEHSPEWQAARAGHKSGAQVRFIDLHWADLAGSEEEPDNRYNDAEFRRSDYVAALCRRLGVEDFHALWDTLIEVHADLTIETYLRRCHFLCGNMRLLEGPGSNNDRRREAFMAAAIRRALEEHAGRLLVVTGGYHSVALHGRLHGRAPEGMAEPADCQAAPVFPGEERGIALTPYSFERLDSLTGYNAGMPNPGFYQQLWEDRQRQETDTHRALLRKVAQRLRDRKQAVSAADLIAAETTAQGLAAMRAHATVWRTDLVDGLIAALIKDELSTAGSHPLLEVIHEVLRGGERGLLAEGTVLPPLVLDVQNLLSQHDLQAVGPRRDLELDLHEAPDRSRSQVLHRMRILEISGYDRVAGTDLVVRDDLARVWERWTIGWTPDFDARCIEAARYGTTLADAAAARLTEQAEAIERDAAAAAALFIDAALAGLTAFASSLRDRFRELVRTDGSFFSVTKALGHLLYLYRYDVALQTAGQAPVGDLVSETFGRSLWLLEGLGQVAGMDKELLDGLHVVRETVERCGNLAGVSREELVQVLRRIGAERGQRPLVRGASLGACWSLSAAGGDEVRAALRQFADPDHLGDFLTGLFALAREQVQRQRDLVVGINDVVSKYADEEFLAALPSLRLAFTYFTPREKHHLALTLREALGLGGQPEMVALTVDADTAARALALEGRLFEAARKYGLRGAPVDAARS
jgi:hypothetical protein